MVEIRDANAIGEKWTTVTPSRAPQYASGVQNPKKDWATATAKANDSWKQGVQKAISNDSFQGGVKKAGTSKWQKGAVQKGTVRYGPGVQAAKDDYVNGFQPYVDVIRSTTLPARGPRRDPRNLERVAKMAQALGAKKESLMRGGGR